MFNLKSRVRELLAGSRCERLVYWLWGVYRPHTWGRYVDRRVNERTREVISRVLRADSNAVDIGCCRGELLQAMVDFAPQGQHYAFEPVPSLAGDLQRRFPTVRVMQMALSERAGTADFFHSDAFVGYSSLTRRAMPGAEQPFEKLQVRVETLDEVLPPDLPVALIKIDVEGVQLEVLRGAARTLRRCRPVVVFEHGETSPQDSLSERVFEFIVGECGYRLATLSGWLAAGPSLSRDDFYRELRQQGEYMFVASV